GHMHLILVDVGTVPEMPVPPEALAMVADDDDEGRGVEMTLFERAEDAAECGIAMPERVQVAPEEGIAHAEVALRAGDLIGMVRAVGPQERQEGRLRAAGIDPVDERGRGAGIVGAVDIGPGIGQRRAAPAAEVLDAVEAAVREKLVGAAEAGIAGVEEGGSVAA